MASPISVVDVVASAGRGSLDSDDADDDRAPFLQTSLPSVQDGDASSSSPSRRPGGRRAGWCAHVDGVPVALRRFPRLRGGLARVAGSADLRWLCRGLALCLLLLVVGAVGSFALRQMVSPEIDALMRERQDLRAGLELLRTQLDNMTRVADSRLDTIHLLESELEKQAVQAAQAAASALANGTGALLPADGAAGGDALAQRGRLASNLAYTSLLGALVFLFVLYRIVRIMQGELLAHQKLAAGGAGSLERGGPAAQSLSPPRSLRGILVDDDLAASSVGSRANASASSRAKTGGAALSPKAGGPGSQPSPQCYKRPQNSPSDRLIV